MNKPLTINIKKRVTSIDDVYSFYILMLEGIASLKFSKQERIALIEILKERAITKKVRDILYEKIGRDVTGNIFTRFRKRGIIKDNKINPTFQEFKSNSVTFNIALTNG